MVYPSSSQTSKQSSKLSPIRILIADDQPLVRTKLQDILGNQENFHLLPMVNDGDEAIAAFKIHQPDVVLMDLEMPKLNGIEAVKIIKQIFSEVKILILSTHERPEYMTKIINAGVDGYLLKHTPAPDLITAINMVYKDYSLFGSKLLKKAELENSKSQKIDLQAKFTPRQKNPQDACQLVDSSSPGQNTDHKSQNKSSRVKPDQANRITKLPPINTEEFLPSIDKWLTWGSLSIVSALTFAMPATSVLKYKTTVKTQATVRPVGELRLVQAAVEGQIAEILVEQGQTVNRGDIIATIDSSRFQTRKKQLTKAIAQQRLQLVQLDSQIKVLESQTIAEQESNNSEILAAKAELSGNRRSINDRSAEANAQVSQANAQLDSARATLKAAEHKAARYRFVASQGALSQEQLAEAELEVQQQQQQIAVAEAELQTALVALNPSTAEIEMAQQRIQQIKKSGQANIARLHREKEALIRQRIEINQQLDQDTEELKQTETDLARTNLTATAHGTISVLNLRNPGQAIQAGQEIAQIIPRDAPLEIKATVPPQEIAKLETNQKVQMRVSACPYPDYGTLNGTVSKVARDTRKPDNNNPSNPQTQQSAPAFYEVTISPEDSSFGRGEDICHLQLGMEGRTDIITREESVMKFILRKAKLINNF